MSFEIKTIENFDRQAKQLAKHYMSFRDIYDKSEQSTISDNEIKRLKKLAEEHKVS